MIDIWMILVLLWMMVTCVVVCVLFIMQGERIDRLEDQLIDLQQFEPESEGEKPYSTSPDPMRRMPG